MADPAYLFRILVSIVEVATISFGFYCTGKIMGRIKEKRKRSTIYLIIVFLFASLAPGAQLFDGLFYPYVFAVKYGYAMVIILTMVINIALLLFATDIFATDALKVSRRALVFRVFFIIGVGSTTAIATVLKLQGQDVTLVLGLYMAISLTLYLALFLWARTLGRKVGDPVYQQAIRYIGYFALAFLACFVFFVVDSFYTDYTIWGLFGWGMYLVGVWAAYRGFIRPAQKKTN